MRDTIPSAVLPGKYSDGERLPSFAVGMCAAPTKGKPGVFVVPPGSDPAVLAVRAHEYAHLATMPYTGAVSLEKLAKRGTTAPEAQTLHDLMANGLACYRGVDVANLPYTPPDLSAVPIEQARLALPALALDIARLQGTHAQASLLQAMLAPAWDDETRVQIEEVCTRIGALANRYSRNEAYRIARLKKRLQLKTALETRDTLRRYIAELQDALEPKAMRPREGKPGEGKGRGLGEAITPATGWGEMRICLPKLLHRPIRLLSLKKYRPDFVGALRHPERALIPAFNGDCFSRRRSFQGGAVLVDVSGSMSLAPAAIEKFVAACPAGNVAIYSSDARFGMAHGVLSVIAEDGRVHHDLKAYQAVEHGSGNVIDGPALRWLLAQQGPRIWVCDGGITGINDSPATPQMHTEVNELLRAGKVQQVRTFDLVLKTLVGKRY